MTIMWEIDAVVGKNGFSDSFMYNDSGNEAVNVGDFVDNFLETLQNNIDDDVSESIGLANLINIAILAYVSGGMSTSSDWGEMHLKRVTEWSTL